MIPVRRSIRALAGALLLASVTFSLSTCGIGGSQYSGGGTGGTGISTGSVSGFGSVVMNGVHYRTDNNVAPGFMTKKLFNGKDNSGRMDRDVFAVGMVVTVRHGAGDNDARVIEYQDNLRGPIAVMTSGADNIIGILGQSVVVDDAATFASLKRGDIVEVSGFADTSGRIRATYIFSMPPPMPPPVQEFEVKGFVSGSSSTGFRIGPLPDGTGATVAVSYGAAAVSILAEGVYVQVTTTDREPVGGGITATRIELLAARTDFPENVAVDLEGLVTTPWTGSGNDLSFAVEGKRVQWNGTTKFVGGGGTPEDTRQANRRVQVRGTEAGGVLSAVNIIFR
ncbi:MAG TPA: DUF5666 domain-containing protein [Terriglobales bacterium]|nr:DUF5666 domain-containing protein [Terriglobales bacterium]